MSDLPREAPGGGAVGVRVADFRWRRLHPLSPVVRSGRGALAVLAAVAGSAAAPAGGPGGVRWTDLVVLPLVLVVAVASWVVTRWRLDGSTLRIETGLLRRDSQQLPVSRIQAVDLVRPFAARVLGLAEVRVRLAGSSHADGRLAYLTEHAALQLRAALLAAHHGLDPATPEPAERIMAVVPSGRLLGSVAISTAGLACAAMAGGAAAAVASPAGPAAVIGTAAWCLAVCFPLVWRRVSAQYGFTVAASPDGIRIRRGLLGTVAETIPVARVQAVRKVEPLLWRPLGWSRLEVDVAGSPGREEGEDDTRRRKLLLPVGRPDQADALLGLVTGVAVPLPAPQPAPLLAPQPAPLLAPQPAPLSLSRPPRRARWKAPLSYHFLAAGYDAALAVSVTGRVRRTTTVVPLAKAQSIRLRQGPVQRRLGLATVHLDAAGHGARAEFRDRASRDSARLAADLAALSRAARRPPPGAPGARAPGAGQAATLSSPANAAHSEA